MAGNAEIAGTQHGNRWRIAAWGTAALVLALPLLAMQFTEEVRWGPIDFLVAGALFLGIGLAYEAAVRMSRSIAYRAAAALALAATLLLIWVNLAVGFIGDEGDPANLLFAGLLGTALVAGIVVRFRPGGMARIMTATAVAQAAITAGAVAARLDGFVIVPPTGVFVALWLGSAWLFGKAARDDASAR